MKIILVRYIKFNFHGLNIIFLLLIKYIKISMNIKKLIFLVKIYFYIIIYIKFIFLNTII